LDASLPHAVERVVRAGEVVFEYALCAPCILRILGEYSQESIENIKAYLQKGETFEGKDILEPSLWLAGVQRSPFSQATKDSDEMRCSRCGLPESQSKDEHTVMGLLVGRHVFTETSFVCAPCSEGVSDVLSKKTKDSNEDVIRRNFPGVPANLDLPVGVIGL
jgi:hypothetical protein